MNRIIVALIAALLISIPSRACSPCVDTVNTLAGTVITSGVVITWETNDEQAGQWYRLLRYACSDLQCSPVVVAIEPAQGPCSTTRAHEKTDDPGAGTWYYSLETWSAGNQRLCTADLEGVEAP